MIDNRLSTAIPRDRTPGRVLLALSLGSLVAACGGGDVAGGAASASLGAPSTAKARPANPGGGNGGGGGGGGGGGPPTAEAASNLSFPVIMSDNVGPAAFPVDGAWRFASITDPATQCVGEAGVPDGTAVSSDISCYYGRHVTYDEAGTPTFDGDPKVWWLQKRPANFWKAMSVGHSSADTKLAVSAVDIGDLLESSPSIATRQIRTEFNLLQSVSPTDPDFGALLVTDWTSPAPSPCTVPTAAGQSVGCFAAVAMSGAVPGTEQSGNEAQGTDFGPGTGSYPGTRTFVDPTVVRPAVDQSNVPVPIHAMVYSHCARLVIQKIDGTPVWNKSTGQWSGPGVGIPVVDAASYSGSYSTEINSGGGIVYGYNWNAQTVPTGKYRLTFVLDGNDAEGPQCTTALTTEFRSGVTKLVNVGESNTPNILYAGDSQLGDEGGLAYIDLTLTARGGGGGGRR